MYLNAAISFERGLEAARIYDKPITSTTFCEIFDDLDQNSKQWHLFGWLRQLAHQQIYYSAAVSEIGQVDLKKSCLGSKSESNLRPTSHYCEEFI